MNSTIVPIIKTTCHCGKSISINADDYHFCDNDDDSTFFADDSGYEAQCDCGLTLQVKMPVSGLGRVIKESDVKEVQFLLKHIESKGSQEQLIEKLNSLF